MLIRKRAYRLTVTVVTFLLGAAFQFLLALWLPSRDVIPLSLIVIIVCLVLILTISSDSLSAMERVIDLAGHSGIRAEYIEDERSGRSYRRTCELIKNAKKHITIVSPWEPFAEYQSGDTFIKIKSNRQNYYEELLKQIDLHIHQELFHKRIIQVPREFEGKPLQFKTDPVFYEYLKHAAEVQAEHPLSCRLQKSATLIHTHFTVIDERYVIMPIFTTIGRERQLRHGVFIFDDRQGDLVKSLNDIYATLDAKSQPIEADQLIAPTEK
jgi:hypothetical protein